MKNVIILRFIIKLILITLSICCLKQTSIDLTSFKEIGFLILAYLLLETKIEINY